MLELGDKVEFKPVPVTRGYLATDVVPLKEGTDAYEGQIQKTPAATSWLYCAT